MPIERDGKHWCDPASETPDEETGAWECPCGVVWQFWPELSVWAEQGVDPRPPAEDWPGAPPETVDPITEEKK